MEIQQLRFGIGLFVAIVIASPIGSAQDAEQGSDKPDADAAAAPAGKKPGYHVNGFRIRPSLSITEIYDSNVFATDKDTLSDWITRTSPNIKIDSTWTEHSLRFRAGADFGRYWDYDGENYLDYWASADGRYDLNETANLFGGVGISFNHEGRDSQDATVGGLEPTTYRSQSAHAGIKTTHGDTTYRIGGTYESLDFDNVPSVFGTLINDDRDRELFGLGIRATHQLDAQNAVFVQALYDKRDYDMGADLNGFERDSDGYRAAIGLENDFGGGNKTEAYVGIIEQDYDDSRFDSVSKVDFGGRLTFLPDKSTKITARLQRSLNETTLAGSPGYINTSLSGRIEFRVSPRLIPHLSFGYNNADYLEIGREDDTYSAEAGVKYYVARNAYILAGARHVTHDSNDKGVLFGSEDYEKNSVFLTFATQGYPLFEPMISDFSTDGEWEIGGLYVTDDSNRFGRYTGLNDDGFYWNSDVHLHSTDGKAGYAAIKGLDLGLDSRSLGIDWGSQGSYEAFIKYDETPFNDFTGKTVFLGEGGSNLTLPANWVYAPTTDGMSELANSLNEVDIGTKRKDLGVGTLLYSADKKWTLALGYDTETKEGTTQTAGVIGESPGNSRSALLPTPIDYTTNSLNASLGYLTDKGQFELAYKGSFFSNNFEELSWESPFNATGSRGPVGSTAQPPENQFHQVTLSGAQVLSDTTRLSGFASVGLMLQDESFLPDTVNPALTPNPQPEDSLDGEVYLYNALLSLTSRPMPGLNLKASYRMQRRDNETDKNEYTYYVNDTQRGGLPQPTDTNQPYSYDKRTLKLDAGYRINRTARLSGDLSRETFERSPSEVKETTEDKGQLKLRLTPLDNVQLSISGGASSRDGTSYHTNPGENTLLRKYNIADRDRVTGGLDIAYQPNDRLSLNANLQYSDDDYDDTEVGLTEAKLASIALDAAYQWSEELSGHAYVGWDRYESEQAGSQEPNSPDWFVDNEDTVDSVGLGLRWKQSERLEIGSEYTFSRSKGETDMKSYNPLPPVSPFPDLETKMHSLRLYADYKLEKNTTLKLSYRYEKYDEDDWSLDGVSPATIPEVLVLGEGDPSYDQHVIGVSLVTRF